MPAVTVVPPTPTAMSTPTATPIPVTIPTERVGHQAIRLPDGRILFGGGSIPREAPDGAILTHPHPYLESFDPVTENWARVPLPGVGLADVKIAPMPDGNVLITGVFHPYMPGDLLSQPTLLQPEDTPSYSLFVLDLESMDMRQLPFPGAGGYSPEFVVLQDGRVLAIGGEGTGTGDEAGSLPLDRNVEIYDPIQNVWASMAPFASDLIGDFGSSGVTLAFQKGFAIDGGAALVVAMSLSDSSMAGGLVLFDAATDSWGAPALFPAGAGRPLHAFASVAGEPYILFGNRIEKYDLESGEFAVWFSPRDLPTGASVTWLGDGRLLISGTRAIPDGDTSLMILEVFDPTTGVWAPGPELEMPRSHHASIVLPDGGILLFGGLIAGTANGEEIGPSNSIDLIKPGVLNKVDTWTEPVEGILDPFAWSQCVDIGDLEELHVSPREIVPPAESGAELLDMAFEAMDSVASYSLATVETLTAPVVGYERIPQVVDCRHEQSLYVAPDKLRYTGLNIQGRRLSLQVFYVHYSYGLYDRYGDSEKWLRRTLESQWLALAPHTRLLVVDTGAFEFIRVEVLNDEHVYHVRAYLPDKNWTISYWIGVDDLLIRRRHFRQYITLPGIVIGPTGEITTAMVEGSTRLWTPDEFPIADTVEEFHSFNEEFDIPRPYPSQLEERPSESD